MKVTPANCGATGPGAGELYDILKALVTTVNSLVTVVTELRTDFNAHLQDGSHTAAANTTGANVTANTVDAAAPTATGLTV